VTGSGRYAFGGIKKVVLLVNFDKIVWGNDGYAGYDAKIYKGVIEAWEKTFKKEGIEQYSNKIFYETARKLLALKPSES